MLTMTVIGADRNAWGYLMGTVSTEHTIDRADSRAAYYMANGTPPGAWAGAGAAALGLTATAGDVRKEDLEALFGEGNHPLTGAALGKRFITKKDADESPKKRQSVAGFEFVFSPPKSVSSWWALADPELKDKIRACHQAAIDATIEKLETDIVRTRSGVDGVAQQHVKGITAALFDHWDSRDGDPQLHTHMLVSNRVQGEDGRWRTIDSRWSLFPAVATAGAYYDTVLMDELSMRFGIDWTTQACLEHPAEYQGWLAETGRPDTVSARHQYALERGEAPGSVAWQILDVPQDLNREYSTRSRDIAAAKDQQIAEYVRQHGRQPTPKQIIRMRQQATLATRKAKQNRSLKALTTSWRERATRHVGESFLFADRVHAAGKARLNDLPLWSFRHDDVHDDAVRDAAACALTALSIGKSTWGRRNAETEALRAIAGWRFRSPADREQVISRIVDQVLEEAIALTPRNTLRAPTRFRTESGESMFHPAARDLFTTREVWDAEERMLEAGRTRNAATVDQELVDELVHNRVAGGDLVLGTDQAAAVENIACSGRLVDVLVGPAGSGKTTSLEKLREIWETQHGAGSVRGLAPTARAAEVLAESLGIVTENTAKWLHETARGTLEADGFSYELHEGDLIIIDEASISGTIALDTLRSQAENAGAKLLLVGDWAQLSAVDAGGTFGLLAADRDDVAELTELHRFKTYWEADASKLLRLGKGAGLAEYIMHGRFSHGLDETIVRDAVDAWKTDEGTPGEDGTLVSLLIAPTNDMVERLNQIARDWRIETGHVDATRETRVQSGVASPGDRIVTRQNQRTLRTDHDRWVKNNDEWTVQNIDPDSGDITAVSGDETVVLPGAYCRDHVQLAYATTAHRSQGRTVDTAHAIIDSTASRETFYVAMTRGKYSNRAYVVDDEDNVLGDNAALGMERDWKDTLEAVLRKQSAPSAHQAATDEHERVSSIRQLAAEYQTLIAAQLEDRFLPLLTELGLIEGEAQESPYLGPVFANLRRAEQHGFDPQETIDHVLGGRETDSALQVLAVLHHRLGKFVDDQTELGYFTNEYGPMLHSFGIDLNRKYLGQYRSDLKLARTIAVLDQQGSTPVEAAVRDALEAVDRPDTRNLPARLEGILRTRHGLTESTPVLAARHRPTGRLVAGLIDRAPASLDADLQDALNDREQAIQVRAEYLVDQAIANEEPWLAELGEPLPGAIEEWRRRAVTVACYRELYGVDSDTALGTEADGGQNRRRDHAFATAALGYQSPNTEQATSDPLTQSHRSHELQHQQVLEM
ncbi:MobF family relaxase [Leucobacter aridicollis]|uniref:MobF family relaxase n=1 Tax=Leucobacter aridicollis TaxID=283878 RepID=UPI0021682357|nr:MobF family relaxase [Leucobacter aridicollis]MCS3427591.1 conjugative relaxase-like TrwC/TraI family protein [Leucobacter aridicollis]